MLPPPSVIALLEEMQILDICWTANFQLEVWVIIVNTSRAIQHARAIVRDSIVIVSHSRCIGSDGTSSWLMMYGSGLSSQFSAYAFSVAQTLKGGRDWTHVFQVARRHLSGEMRCVSL